MAKSITVRDVPEGVVLEFAAGTAEELGCPVATIGRRHARAPGPPCLFVMPDNAAGP